jgi:membrane protease YdiL (CAAX protease family)
VVELEETRDHKLMYTLGALGGVAIGTLLLRAFTGGREQEDEDQGGGTATRERVPAPPARFRPARLHRPPEVLAVRYVLFIQAWAGLGEELFYRGYVQNQLRHRTGPLPAIAVASFLFAVRHYTQVLITWPAVPWWPATLGVAATLIVGVGIGLLYERTRSLLPPIVCHYVFNLMA